MRMTLMKNNGELQHLTVTKRVFKSFADHWTNIHWNPRYNQTLEIQSETGVVLLRLTAKEIRKNYQIPILGVE